MMKQWVTDFGLGPACSVQEKTECDERELGYIEKVATKNAGEQTKQLERLSTMQGKKMSPDAAKWISKRIAILKQFAAAAGSEEL